MLTNSGNTPEVTNRINKLFEDNHPHRVVTRLREFYEGYDLSALNKWDSSLYMNIAILLFNDKTPKYLSDDDQSDDDYYVARAYYDNAITYVYFNLIGNPYTLIGDDMYTRTNSDMEATYDTAKMIIGHMIKIISNGLSDVPYFCDIRSWITNWTPEWKPPFNHDDNFDDDTDDTEYDYQTILMRRDLPEEPNPLPRLFCFHCNSSHEYATCVETRLGRSYKPNSHENIHRYDITRQYPELKKKPMRFKRWTS